jgi:hypothetical protein
MKLKLFSEHGYFYLFPSINIVRYYEAYNYTSATLAPGQVGTHITKTIAINIGFLLFELYIVIYKEK